MKKNEIIASKENGIRKYVDNISENQNSGELKHQLKKKLICYSVRSVNISPDNRYLIVTNADNPQIKVIDLQLLEHVSRKYNSHTKSVRLTSITKDSSAFYTASWDGNSHKYEIESGICVPIVGISGLPMPSCFISNDEKYLFTANYISVYGLGKANRGKCWDLVNKKLFEYPHQERKQYPGTMDITYDGKYVYSGSDDGIAYKWSLKSQKTLIKFFDLPLAVRKIFVTKRFFAAACSDGTIRIYYKTSGKKYKHLIHNLSDECMDVRITKDESKLVSASMDGTIKCFDLLTGISLYHIKPHKSWIWSIGLYNNDQQIVSGSKDGTVVFMTIKGDILARYYNLPGNDFLISCPKEIDKMFPNGCFYTSNNKLINVFRFDKKNGRSKVLEENDNDRIDYIKRLNQKNIIISKIINNDQYKILSDNYNKHKKLLEGINNNKSLKLLSENKNVITSVGHQT